jgi:hypothetical protein
MQLENPIETGSLPAESNAESSIVEMRGICPEKGEIPTVYN